MGGGPPGFLQGFSCPVVLWILSAEFQFRLPDFHLLWCAFPKHFNYLHSIPSTVLNPKKLCLLVWPLSLSLAATQKIDFSFSSCRYLDVSVHDVPSYALWIHSQVTVVLTAGFPHSDTHGSLTVCVSPWPFAAFRVLLRFLMPRHSPFALISLTFDIYE